MITYTIGGSGGPLYRGIPSLNVAISMLSDLVRYDDTDEVIVRTALEVTLAYVEEHPEKYWQVSDEYGRPDLVISEEPRCDHCFQIVLRSAFHDSTKQGSSPTTIAIEKPISTGASVYEDRNDHDRLTDPKQQLPWKRKWRCPQCDAHGIQRELSAIDWHDHLAEHTVQELGEVLRYASHYRATLEMILDVVRDLPEHGFSPEVIYHKIQWECERMLGWKDSNTPHAATPAPDPLLTTESSQ